jgi:hypothetical protein
MARPKIVDTAAVEAESARIEAMNKAELRPHEIRDATADLGQLQRRGIRAGFGMS